jgi:UDP-N-acetylmuramoylalanine--D-glutamate ligase
VNDSKATNAEATRPALHAYKNIYWLAGGVPKADGIDPLFEKDMVNIRHAFFYGQAGQTFFDVATHHNLPCSLFDTMENALNAAYTMAQNDTQDTKDTKTILLSPCCASFDAFDNFEHRGTVFKKLCEGL